MSNYKEIVTKAVIGKGKKVSSNSYTVSPEKVPNTVLGCWVINHNFNGANNMGKVLVNGAFDVNIWYSYDNDTKTTVNTQRFNYEDKMNVKLKDMSELTNNSEIIVRSLRQPTVTNVEIEDGKIKMDIEKELGIEIVGDTKVKVSAIDEEDDYEDILDTDEEIEKSIDETLGNINENYVS